MDKQKQIEEMANVMYDEMMSVIDKSKVLLLAGNAIRMSNELATAIYNAGYRKIPEGAVVLTREELANMRCENIEAISQAQEHTRIETAEKFAEKFKEKMKAKYQGTGLWWTEVVLMANEIAKEFTGDKS